MSTIQVQNVVWKEGKHYGAQCLNVDVSSFGENKEEALQNLQEALELYFEDQSVEGLIMIEKPELFSRKLVRA